jgi:hypothetical protein
MQFVVGQVFGVFTQPVGRTQAELVQKSGAVQFTGAVVHAVALGLQPVFALHASEVVHGHTEEQARVRGGTSQLPVLLLQTV